MISLENIINITLFAINKKGLNIYNCTDSPHYTIKELIEIICELRGFNKPLLSIPLYVAYIIAIPFELFSKLLNRDLKISRERFYKFSKATDYRSELLRAEGYIQVYSPKERIHSLAKWFLKEKL
jgi:nucleoside-diphosphate-sugar epimerase